MDLPVFAVESTSCSTQEYRSTSPHSDKGKYFALPFQELDLSTFAVTRGSMPYVLKLMVDGHGVGRTAS